MLPVMLGVMLFYVEILSIMPDYAPMLLGPIMLKIMLAESAKAYQVVHTSTCKLSCTSKHVKNPKSYM